MAGRVTVLTPVDATPAIELGNSTWRKQILPVGWLDYGDGASKRRLNFTPAYLRDIVTAFKANAFPGVPLQLGAEHNNDPENTAGQIIGLDSDDRGLYATVSATDRGDRLIRDNPNLGVSVRVVEDYERQDGRSKQPFKAALQHVLATWVPRVAGLAPWAAVECSQETVEVIDLSALSFTASGGQQNTPDPSASPGEVNQKETTPVAPQLTDEELTAVRAIFPVIQKLAQSDEGAGDDASDTPEAPTANVTELPAPSGTPTDAEVDSQVDEAIAAAQPDTDNAVELAQIEMRSQMDRMAIELAEVRSREDAARWAYESEQLVRDYGIPPAIVTLAEPLLRGSKHVVELAQGNTVDAGQVLRTVLHTVAKTYGKRVDLSAAVGTSRDIEESDAMAADRKRIHESARAAGFGS